ncbi:ferritin-like domain-containing protein [Chondrinema litorale]|uniref:YciE/YciF ferroxidase family protein n=1 Tax=Chondrinema litorale TaxID=2994555 RepID=UPI00254382B8|nr:DUF892 family protein [Chondrinema litorale]UZR96044.1 DUF892 family protein [Chondrinema litorale]
MEPINNLRDLFIELLKDRYDSEQQQIEAFPKMMREASSTELKHTIQNSIDCSSRHIFKLKEIFKKVKTYPEGDLCEANLSMINEVWKLMNRSTNPEVKDASIITAIQHIHHYDIAGYSSLSAYAKALGMYESAHILLDMLEEEKEMDSTLRMMTVESINVKANKESFDEA